MEEVKEEAWDEPSDELHARKRVEKAARVEDLA